jgi:DNA ligase (NAD+)
MDLFDMDEVTELEEELDRADEAYYSGSESIMSDQVYDAKEMKLRELSPNSKHFSKVGSNLKESTFSKVKHDTLMLSLDKGHSLEEVVGWRKSTQDKPTKGIGMPKMDGFALSLKYELQGDKYVLMVGATRGKGQYGDDLTENVKQILDIPHTVNRTLVKGYVDKFEVRGEAYMKHSTFVELGLDKIYENCRNIAPGSVQQKDPNITRSRKMSFFSYNLIGLEYDTMTERFQALKEMGFPVVDHTLINLDSDAELQMTFNYFEANREINDYDIDGVVIMINDIDTFEELGNTSHHPRGAIAWKFEAEEGETTFLECRKQVSRTGLVNPVGIYEPIRIDGANLTNATLHNWTIVEELGIGIGDKIIVSRRGGVIPKIERVVTSAGHPIEVPVKCPVCGSELEMRITKDKDERAVKTLYCISLDCPAQVLTRIVHFVSVMDIMDVGESLITKMIEAGYVETPADLFKITKEQLLTLESVQEKTASRTLKNIELARKKTLAKFLASLGITNLGTSISELVANHFENIDNVLNANSSDFIGIPGIGDIMSVNIVKGLKAKSTLIAELRSYIDIIGIEPKKVGGCLSGKSFLITGTLSEPRGYFEKLIEDNGGALKSSVSKTLDYLLVGDNAGGKLDKAKKAGVNLITEDQFNEMLK